MPKEREDKQFKSSSGICNIHAVIWYPDSDVYKKPVGVIQIAHGMIDHIERFEEMAEYFTGKGFVVAGNDHLGHGDSVNSDEDLGYFAKGNHGADFLIKDMHRLTLIMKKNYPDLPYVLIGHSMGSYMSRKYASIYGDELDGVIFLGTGNQPKAVVDSGLKLAHIAKLVRGERYRSELLNTIMFGAYNKRIKDNRTANDWLTKDTKIVDEYLSDPKCSYKFTANAYIGFLNVIKYDIDKKKIQMKELPAIDDEFAKDVSEFDTLEEYKADVREKLTQSKQKQEDERIRRELLEKAVANAEMIIPGPMVDEQADSMIQNFANSLRYQGISMEQYMSMTGGNIASLRASVRPDAERRIKDSLVLEAIAKAENLEITDEDFEKEVADMAETYHMEVEKLRESLTDADQENIREEMKSKKAMEFLVENSKEA